MDERREHTHIPKLKEQLCERKIDRRDFLRYSTLLGMSAGAAYAFAGKVTGEGFVRPARAQMPKGGVLRLGMRVHEIHNPHAYNWLEPANISTQMLGQLAVTGQDNITRPSILESWEASDDLKTWTLNLRQLKWHSGRDFTADDVMWNFEHILDPATGSSSIGLFKAYLLDEYDTGKKDKDGKAVMSTRLWDANAIEKVDDRTIRLNLKVPQMAVPEDLNHYTNQIGDPEDGGVLKVGSNGLGAFELVEHQVGIKAVLKARPGPYFKGGPYLDRLEFVDLGDDMSANLAALASKQVHGLYRTSVQQYDVLKRLPHVDIHEAKTASTAVAQMKVTRKPFDNPLVRKAFRHATDSEAVVKLAVRGLGAPGEHHHVAPVHPAYAPLPNMYDPEKAKALLAEAGFPDGIDVTFNCKKDPAWELAAVQAMGEQWKKSNIRAKINVMPSAQFWDVWDKFDFGFVEWAHRPLGLMVLALGYRSGVPWNAFESQDKVFDDLLTEAAGILDVDERRKVMEKIERHLQDNGPIAQPVWQSVITATDKRVKGFKMHPARFFFGHELAIES